MAALDCQAAIESIDQIISSGRDHGYVGYYRFALFQKGRNICIPVSNLCAGLAAGKAGGRRHHGTGGVGQHPAPAGFAVGNPDMAPHAKPPAPVTAVLLSMLVRADGLFLLWDQRQVQECQRVRLMEQYLPMVEELVESVWARQHEFNDRMMEVSAVVNTAGTLEEAQTAVVGLLEQEKGSISG